MAETHGRGGGIRAADGGVPPARGARRASMAEVTRLEATAHGTDERRLRVRQGGTRKDRPRVRAGHVPRYWTRVGERGDGRT